ncbi:hypothetical protein B7L44_05235 [Acinetobacter nosocomialis]|uniref:hypothetical protein n=1 Tax=Acinetobacter nosocomialis TaxID=106654 RepID=UPI0009E0FE68|nr:hypothetical protein [Acinetobacter nosocomialis]ARG16045.1 hypothetical protein B7L44_05235 [Acinetobacter nosocomialis]
MQTNLSNQQPEGNLQEFIVGDMVVIQDHIMWPLGSDSIFCITEIKSDFLGDHVSMTDIKGNGWTSGTRYIRHATVAELNAKRRLTNAEHALAEVS